MLYLLGGGFEEFGYSSPVAAVMTDCFAPIPPLEPPHIDGKQICLLGKMQIPDELIEIH